MIYIKNTGKSFNRRSLIKLFITTKPETFSDAECTQSQCEEGKFRSLTELLEIVRTYYPKTSVEGFMTIIRDLIQGDNNIGLVWCTRVNKVVLKYGVAKNELQESIITKYSKDRYYEQKGVDGYSLKDYEDLIKNLKN